MPNHYDNLVRNKTADQRLADPSAADTNLSPYLLVAAQVRSTNDLVDALKKASSESERTSQKVFWLTVVIAVFGGLQAIATAWPYIVWWLQHSFKFK